MNLGQAQAVAAQLAMSGGSPADLATLLEDVNNITGVSSAGGGFGRWVAGGRQGGYFMDPGLAAQQVKKAYDSALTAQRSGRSKQLMDAYRQVQIQKAQQGMIKQVADMQRQRAEAASRIAEREAKAEDRRKKTEMKITKFNHEFPITLWNLWLKGAKASNDLGKELARKAGGKGGSGIKPQDLTKYQAQLKSDTNALENFTRNNLKSSADAEAKLNSAIASADAGERLNLDGLTDEQIIALYGSDMKAYKRDVRKAEQTALTDDQKAELKKTLEERKKKLTARKQAIADLRKSISASNAELLNYLGSTDPKKVKKEKLDKLNSEIEDLKDKLTDLLAEG
jgi:hypothetical protein